MAISHYIVASMLALGLAAPALGQASDRSPVKRYVLRDATTSAPSFDEALGYPSLAEDQDRTVGRGRKVTANEIRHKDVAPPPCEPSWTNLWCFGSSTTACKLNRICQPGEGLCFEGGAKCYTYNDEAGHQQCASCS
jgi:hypothetical protein